jgi:hypothetical protein
MKLYFRAAIQYKIKNSKISTGFFFCFATFFYLHIMANLSLYSIKAVVLLDASGNRVLAKYYGSEQTSLKEQKAFEKGLFEKTRLSQGKTTFIYFFFLSLY